MSAPTPITAEAVLEVAERLGVTPLDEAFDGVITVIKTFLARNDIEKPRMLQVLNDYLRFSADDPAQAAQLKDVHQDTASGIPDAVKPINNNPTPGMFDGVNPLNKDPESDEPQGKDGFRASFVLQSKGLGKQKDKTSDTDVDMDGEYKDDLDLDEDEAAGTEGDEDELVDTSSQEVTSVRLSRQWKNSPTQDLTSAISKMTYQSKLAKALKSFASELQDEKAAAKKNPATVKRVRLKFLNLIESFTHLPRLQEIRQEIERYINTLMHGNLAESLKRIQDAPPMLTWALEISYFANEDDHTMSQAHFLAMRNYMIKFKIIELYQQRIAESEDPKSLVAQSIALYKQERFRITRRHGHGGGNGNEDESIIKQICANENARIPRDQYFSKDGISERAKAARASFTTKLANAKPVADLGLVFGPGVYMLLPKDPIGIIKAPPQPFRTSVLKAIAKAVPELRIYCDCLALNVWTPCINEQIDVLRALPFMQPNVDMSMTNLLELVSLPFEPADMSLE